MSGAIKIAKLIRERLLTTPAAGELPTSVDLTKVDVIIDRQVAILSLVEAAVAKVSGCAVVILWQGFQIPDRHTSRPRMAHRFTLTVWSQQVIDDGHRPADLVVESLAARLWQWTPVAGDHAYGELQVGGGDMVPDRSYLVYELEVIAPN